MKIAYLDCFAGAAGDMFLGALLNAGVPLAVLEEATAALGIGAALRVETVDRSGISCTKVHVMEGGRLADGGLAVPQEQAAGHTHSHQIKTQHLHKGGHAHEHGNDRVESFELETSSELTSHVHGRSLTAIKGIIGAASLRVEVKAMAIKAFDLLGASEAKIHDISVEEIHFHEVGAVDAIVDIVATCAGVHHLRIGQWYSSPVNVGGGMVECAHGTFPVPAPATADLLRGVPTYSARVQKELVTPTGAALLRMLAPKFGAQPAMVVEAIGYGAGTRNPKDFPNVLRLSVGSDSSTVDGQTVTVLETALDDLSPQVIAYVAERLLAEGALDVMLTPVVMKKGRPGTLVTVLCDEASREMLQGLLLRETSTLGIRVRTEKRVCLERSFVAVATEYGPIRVKVGSDGGEVRNVAPEFDDCRKAAEAAGVALKVVQQAALAGYGGRRE